MASAPWREVHLATLAVCDETCWLRVRWGAEAGTPSASLEVMAELSRITFNAVACLTHLDLVHGGQLLLLACAVAFSEYCFCFKQGGGRRKKKNAISVLASCVGLASLA